MSMIRVAVLALALAFPSTVPAQAPEVTQGFDPELLLGGVQDVLTRTPDREIDGLFQALHGSMQQPDGADAICSLFDVDAQRSLDHLNAVALRLPETSRQRFADAVAVAVMSGLQGQPQAWDRAVAAQALKANGARAAILHDGFAAGFADNAPRQARCRSLGQMLAVLQGRPLAERVLITRLLLEQGLRQVSLR